MKRVAFKPKPIDPKTGERRFGTFKRPTVATLSSSKPIERTAMKRRAPKARTVAQGADPEYLAFVRRQRCCACGSLPPNHAHHETLGGRGKSQKAPDRRTLPFCFGDHDDFHLVRGRFNGWSREKRKAFQSAEIDRLNGVWDYFKAFGVLAEPLQQAV